MIKRFYKNKNEYDKNKVWFGLVWFLCFNGVSTFVGYLMSKQSL